MSISLFPRQSAKEILLQNKVFYIHKTNARSKNFRLSFNQKGEIVVTTPSHISKKVVDDFVVKHIPWIQEQVTKLNYLKNRFNLKQDQILFFGKAHTVRVLSDHSKKIRVTAEGESILINPINTTKDSIQKSLDRFLQSQIQTFILEKTHQYARLMGISFNQISFKNQQTRWGSCSSRGNLNFNIKLVHTPKEVVEYVIIHELAHRLHMDHSVAFWKVVEQYCPEYRKFRGWLKRNGMALS